MSRLPGEYIRSIARALRLGWRRISYAVRFAGQQIEVHPTAWVARKAILRCTDGGKIVVGKFCELHSFSMIDPCGGSVIVGDHCSLNPFAVIYGHGGARLGDRVRIATHSVIIPANHNFRAEESLHESGVSGVGITVGNDVWIGSGARILDGVTIGDRCVIAAGAVVTRTVPAHSIAKGVPARASVYDAVKAR
jgi:acetyltransferase-like isoleucine patch superfamily enzyme